MGVSAAHLLTVQLDAVHWPAWCHSNDFKRCLPLQVLDDNCLLCLPNGERLKLNASTMRILFEVGDLTQASPATVSRCGMVYMPPSDLGWQAYIR